ncbi:hypothetical protein QTP88_006394 [Uroleucon formosanum]
MSNSKSPRSSWNKNILPYGNITRKHSISVTVRGYIQGGGKGSSKGKVELLIVALSLECTHLSGPLRLLDMRRCECKTQRSPVDGITWFIL